jgi:hypothetical protein
MIHLFPVQLSILFFCFRRISLIKLKRVLVFVVISTIIATTIVYQCNICYVLHHDIRIDSNRREKKERGRRDRKGRRRREIQEVCRMCSYFSHTSLHGSMAEYR